MQAITQGAALSADWTLVTAFTIIGFLLVFISTLIGRHFIKTIDALTTRVEILSEKINSLEKINIQYKMEMDVIKGEHQKYFTAIMNKLDMI